MLLDSNGDLEAQYVFLRFDIVDVSAMDSVERWSILNRQAGELGVGFQDLV